MQRLVYILFLNFVWGFSQVGINTDNPQEALHLASSTGTMRVESLNWINNPHNGGDVDGDNDLSNNTYPLYVDENGDFTLQLEVLHNSDAADELDDTLLPNSTATLLGNDTDGLITTEIKTYNLIINRPTLLEVKYNISHHIYNDDSFTVISDLLARRVSNYITVIPDPDPNDGINPGDPNYPRKYGPSSKSYTSGSVNSVTGPFFNGQTVYIKFEQAGTYTLSIVGEVSSNTKWSGASGTQSRPTYVEFATDSDFLFFRLY